MSLIPKLGPRNLLIALHDAAATIAAVVVSFYFRFENENLAERLPVLLIILPYFTGFSIVVCYLFGLTTTKWRFVSLPDVLNIIRASSILAVALVALDYIFVAPNVYGAFFFGKTTIVIYWILQILFLIGLRFVYRYFRYSRSISKVRSSSTATTLVAGLAADTELFLRSVENGAVLGTDVVGILSPSRSDLGQVIRQKPVLGGLDDLEDIVNDFANRGKSIQRLILTPSVMTAESHPEVLLSTGRRLGLAVSRLPAMDDHPMALRLAPIAVEDLLLRPGVKIDYRRLEAFIKGKSVVVTGGGGSIGSEICERIVALRASRILIIENAETALYSIVEKLKAEKSEVSIDGRIADIRDYDRLSELMVSFHPDFVFHAAALKHVPILERDWGEAVKTNIFGSVNVAKAAQAAGAKAMVMISTDKAIEPVSMLGLTKRFAEMYCQALDAQLSSTPDAMRLISVRFGNVLASNGSVVPKFKAQIEAGGPVTVTHPDMVRYFMTIQEACDLVITAASHALQTTHNEASVYVLNMGQPVKIVDLADRMIRLAGFEPGRDIQIVFTGIRAGERLHEIIFATQEPTQNIGIEGVLAARPIEPDIAIIQNWHATLREAISRNDVAVIRTTLLDAVPEFKDSETHQ